MLNNSSKMMFYSILINGTIITISSSSWLGAWMGLEMNLLAFIPLMSKNKMISTEASLKYFLIQVLASSMLLFTIMLMMMNPININLTMINMMIMCSLLIKMGAAPFHFWYPNVLEGLSWSNSFILMVWQKISPLMLISYIMFKPLLFLTIIMSTLIGAIGGLNQTSLRKLMAYSSINHLSWMLMTMFYSNSLWMIYFMFYSFLNFSMIILFNSFKISYINQLFSLFNYMKNFKYFLCFNLLSLGGLPPFLGFFPKLMTIQLLSINNNFFLMTFMVMMALITLYFYIRLCFSTFLLNYYEKNWFKPHYMKSMNQNLMMIFSFISSTSLFLFFSLYFLF
uniref:NADH-ubiquinone oxidoreductase chain 2 n=1 Tax=Phaonia fuscata TaxID=2719084 RepID=A0A7G7CDK9_9MUSC|nr:NADH dehydrogenase subunit 2 [Phaonia fuscata]